jgi:hypothetical protein
MQRSIKVKATQVPLRKSAMTGSAAARRTFPAWIESEDRAPVLTSAAVTKRVRDALVLRTVAKKKSAMAKGSTDDSDAR